MSRKPTDEPKSFAPTAVILLPDRWEEAVDAFLRARARLQEAQRIGVGVEEAKVIYEAAVASAEVLFGGSP